MLKERVILMLLCNREKSESCERVKRIWPSSCDIWLHFDTLQSGRRIFPRAVRPSNRARDNEREWPGERERARDEVTHIPESRRVGQTPQTIKTRWPSLSHPFNIPLFHQSCLLDQRRLYSTPWLTLILPKMPLHDTQPFVHDITPKTHTNMDTCTLTHEGLGGIIVLECLSHLCSPIRECVSFTSQLWTPYLLWGDTIHC